MILGDFNLYHPIWGGPGINRWHTGAELVLELIEDYQLELITPIGLVTREKNKEKLALDLAIYTLGLMTRTTHQILEGFHGSDYRPIEIIITSMGLEHNQSPTRRYWKRLNKERL